MPNELTLLTNNLPSGYHRDMQLTKECLFPAIQDLKNCLEIIVCMFNNIIVRKDILSEKKYEVLFTVEKLNSLVLSGMPFRDAYKEVAAQVENKTFVAETELNHLHEGSIGNLCNDRIRESFYGKLENIQHK